MKKALSIALLCSPLLACEHSALVRVQRDSAERETRIAEKERELTIQENQRQALIAEQKTLLSEMESRQMTIDELNGNLEQLRKENARMTADNESQQKKKEQLDLQLRKYQADIAALQKDTRLPDNEKKKRIEELKKQISAHLKLMLAL